MTDGPDIHIYIALVLAAAAAALSTARAGNLHPQGAFLPRLTIADAEAWTNAGATDNQAEQIVVPP